MNNKMKYVLIFVVVALAQLLVFQGIKGDFETVATEGKTFRLPVQVRPYRGYGEEDYASVFRNDLEVRWLDADKPRPGEWIYVAVAADEKNNLVLKGATLNPPPQGEYIRTIAIYETEGIVHFDLPFQRFYLDRRQLRNLPWGEILRLQAAEKPIRSEDEEEVPAEENQPAHELVAVVRLHEGEGVITDILVDGRSLHSYYATSAEQKVQVTPTEKTEVSAATDTKNKSKKE